MGVITSKSVRVSSALERLPAIALLSVLILSILIATLAVLIVRPRQATAATGDMILFWDGLDSGGGSISVPSGWTEISSTYSGRMPRGEAAANFGTTGGHATHTHHVETVATIGAVTAQTDVGLGGTNIPFAEHTHPTLPTVDTLSTESNSPATRTIRIIRYNSGIPTTIPNGAIVMFDDSPGMPATGFTRMSAYDGKTLKVHTTAGTNAGSDTHNHTVTWAGNLTGVPSQNTICGGIFWCWTGATAMNMASHSHAKPGTTTSTDASSLPPYIQPILAKADADVDTSSVGLTAMFEGAPGTLWTSRSQGGGPYYRRFLRPDSTYNAGGGSAVHSHYADGLSGASTGGGTVNSTGGYSGTAPGHKHTVRASFYNGASDSYYTSDNEYFLPEFFDVVVAERVTLSLDGYRWYENSGSQAVTDPWSPLDVPESNMIPSLPVGYRPPVVGNELRLRVRVLVGNVNLAATTMDFKLQYKAGSDNSCTTDSWTDVGAGGGGAIWRFATSSIAHNTSLTTSVLSSSVRETYSKANPTSKNPNAANVGQTMEYDYHIQNNGANGATQYSFRVVEGDGSLISDYSQCPTLVTSPVTSQQMRHGNFFQDGTEAGFFWAD